MIVGVDEVGRGCLIGNVVACALILPVNLNIIGLTDSKKINAKKRAQLFTILTNKCKFAIGEANHQEIDEINILNATMLAMQRAINQLNVNYTKVLVDGNKCPNVKNCVAIIKGDLTEPAISAASIVAKVTRDKQMLMLDKIHPNYGFAKHKGYATKQHLQALTRFGILAQHRKSFSPIKNSVSLTKKNHE